MLFHTPEFLFLMIIAFVLYYFLPRLRLYILAVADMIFYSVGGIGYLGLFLFISTAPTYCPGNCRVRVKSFIYGWLFVLNVGNLVFFKYTFFILTNLGKLFTLPLLNQNSLFQHLLLPIGISFYTFELIAYLVDVYQGKIPPARSWMVFWVFISFFPHRVAGPIMRGKDLIAQVSNLPAIAVGNTVSVGISLSDHGFDKKDNHC